MVYVNFGGICENFGEYNGGGTIIIQLMLILLLIQHVNLVFCGVMEYGFGVFGGGITITTMQILVDIVIIVYLNFWWCLVIYLWYF